MRVVFDSLAIVLCIIVYVFYFSWFGYSVFIGTM